jgi:hypothetical protein
MAGPMAPAPLPSRRRHVHHDPPWLGPCATSTPPATTPTPPAQRGRQEIPVPWAHAPHQGGPARGGRQPEPALAAGHGGQCRGTGPGAVSRPVAPSRCPPGPAAAGAQPALADPRPASRRRSPRPACLLALRFSAQPPAAHPRLPGGSPPPRCAPSESAGRAAPPAGSR